MFIRASNIVRLFKEAYKGIGLRIANTGDGLILTGRAWHMFIFRENLPKEILGEIIKLTGDIPDERRQLLYSKDSGTQAELFLADPCQDVYKRATEAQAEGHDARCTSIIITDVHERPHRVCRTAERAYVIPEGIQAMISTEWCDQNEEMYGCFAGAGGWLYWVSNFMAFGFPAFTAGEDVQDLSARLMEKEII